MADTHESTGTHDSTGRWDFDRVFRLMLMVAVVLGGFALLRCLADVLIPFAVALLLAYLLNPVASALEARIQHRVPAVLITVFGCMLVLMGLGLILIRIGGSEIESLGELVRQVHVTGPSVEDLQSFPNRVEAFIEQQDNDAIRRALQAGYDRLGQIEVEDLDFVGLAAAAFKRIAPGLMGVVTGALSFLVGLSGLVIVVLYVVFLLIDYRLIAEKWQDYLPPKHRANIVGFLDEFALAMSRYFRGQFMIAAIVGVLFAIGFSLIGLRMAILLGLFVGLLNMVPYLQTVGLVPALLLALVRAVESGQSVWVPALLTLAVFGVVQTLQDAVLTPRIMGKTTGLRPVMLLLGIFIWGKLLGFLGLVLAIPLTCLGLAYYRRFVLGDANAKVIAEEQT